MSSLFSWHTGPIIESNSVYWLKAVELFVCLLSSPEVSQVFTQKLLITVYLQNHQKHSCFPYSRLPFNWLYPSGMIGHQHFFPRKKVPTGTFSVIFISGNAWLLCLIRGTFQHAIGYQFLIFKNEAIPLCLRKQKAEISSGYFYSFHLAQRRRSLLAPWVSQTRCGECSGSSSFFWVVIMNSH